MYIHHLEEMAKQLVLDGVITQDDLPATIKALQKCWVDQIAIVWSTVDVKTIAPNLHPRLRREVLAEVLDNLDATMGVTWDTLSFYADVVAAEYEVDV